MKHRMSSTAVLVTLGILISSTWISPVLLAQTADGEPFAVVSTDPPPGAVVPWAPGRIRVVFNRAVLPLSVNNESIRVSRIRDDGREIRIHSEPRILRLRNAIRVGLPGGLVAGVYQIRIRGDVDARNRSNAELLALEQTRWLLPQPRLVQRVFDDLVTIRDRHPGMTAVSHAGGWAPGVVLIRLTPAARDMFDAGRHRRLRMLNRWLGAVEVRNIFANWFHIRFANRYNPIALARIYERVRGVEIAGPDGRIGDGSWIRATPPRYTFSIGFGDCLAGCAFRHTWDFLVEGEEVTLLEIDGPLPEEIPPSYLFDIEGNLLRGGTPVDPATGVSARGSDFVARFTVAGGN